MILGITGKIASGKSEVAKILKNKGFLVIDADKIVHDLYEKNMKGAKVIKKHFGEDFFNKEGSVDRKKLGEFVYTDIRVLNFLNWLIHPLVFNEIKLKLKKIKSKNIVIEAVYFDKNYLSKIVDKITLVSRDDKTIKKVLLNDRKIDKKYVDFIVSTFKKPESDYLVLKNDGSLNKLKNAVDKLLTDL
ncbi:MAG: dephospho-CoA kinase [Candidatus Gracilibacteria bacterium]|jgi:dephospho-CoA kinase